MKSALNKTIGIIGLGWLGLPLAHHLHHSGFNVKGTTTHEDKLKKLKQDASNIDVYQLVVSKNDIRGQLEFFKSLKVLIINIPPGRKKGHEGEYVDKIKKLSHHILENNIPNVIFISSISVYGDDQGVVDEETIPVPSSESGKIMLAAEDELTQNSSFHTTIIRFGGLINSERHPAKVLSGRKNLKGGSHYINLIHQNDCLEMIKFIIEHDHWNEIFNGVFPYHPTKADYYTQKALELHLQPPEYTTEEQVRNPKKVLSVKYLKKNGRFFTSIK